MPTIVENCGKHSFSSLKVFFIIFFCRCREKKTRPIEDPGFSSSRALALTRSARLWIWAPNKSDAPWQAWSFGRGTTFCSAHQARRGWIIIVSTYGRLRKYKRIGNTWHRRTASRRKKGMVEGAEKRRQLSSQPASRGLHNKLVLAGLLAFTAFS